MPVLGICYGEQAMAQQLGGKVEGGHHREFGRAEVEVQGESPLFEGVWQAGEKYPVWMSHGDRVTKLPPGFRGARHLAERAVRRDRGRGAQILRDCSSTPRWCTRRTARRCSRNFVRKIAGLPRRLDHARLQATRRSRRSARRSARAG